jgi:hypothetical protein
MRERGATREDAKQRSNEGGQVKEEIGLNARGKRAAGEGLEAERDDVRV